MNIAILMAQSEYRNLPKLSACKNDLQLMRSVVEIIEQRVIISENKNSFFRGERNRVW